MRKKNPEKKVKGYYSKNGRQSPEQWWNVPETRQGQDRLFLSITLVTDGPKKCTANPPSNTPPPYKFTFGPFLLTIRNSFSLRFAQRLSLSLSLSLNCSLVLISRVSFGNVVPLLLLICKRCSSLYFFSTSTPLDSLLLRDSDCFLKFQIHWFFVLDDCSPLKRNSLRHFNRFIKTGINSSLYIIYIVCGL